MNQMEFRLVLNGASPEPLFLFIELWLIAFKIYGDTPGVPPTKNEVVLKSPNLQMRIDLTINF